MQSSEENAADLFYLRQPEPARGCLLALRQLILKQDKNLSAAWKYSMPFFCYKNKMCCYLWVDKSTGQPYLGIVEGKHIHHPQLVQEKRSRMKVIRFDAERDLPMKIIETILQQVLELYRSGKVKS